MVVEIKNVDFQGRTSLFLVEFFNANGDCPLLRNTWLQAFDQDLKFESPKMPIVGLFLFRTRKMKLQN
jgi:hypothetical protein